MIWFEIVNNNLQSFSVCHNLDFIQHIYWKRILLNKLMQ